MRLLLALVCITVVVNGSCPPGLTPTFGNVCSVLVKGPVNSYCRSLLIDNVDACKAYPKTTPIIIRDAAENAQWASHFVGYAVLGIQYNMTTSKYEWVDGTAIEWTPPGFSLPSYDPNINFNMGQSGDWYLAYVDFACASMDFFCMTTQTETPQVDDCADFIYDNEDDRCYQAIKEVETWTEAQTICKSFAGDLVSVHNVEENSFIRRLAVSRGLVNGVMLGALHFGKNKDYGWMDGSDWNYDNFIQGFPIDGFGDCVAMDTTAVDGGWANVDCNTKMSFICAKGRNAEEPKCESVRKEGELIYSPGFPYESTTPCDFFMETDPGKQVEVEILYLELNRGDYLLFTEGSLGGDLIANISVSVPQGTKFTTTSSNVMRASWQPSGKDVAGMMVVFRGVASSDKANHAHSLRLH